MKKTAFYNFKRIITDQLTTCSRSLNYKAEVLKKRVEEIKSSGSISGHDYNKLLAEYFVAYDKAVDDCLQQIDALVEQFKQSPNEKQFEEIKNLYISHFSNCLSHYQKKHTECQGNNQTNEISFNLKSGNTSSKISAFFFKMSKVVKSQNSIDVIKVCTILGVILTAFAPVIEKLWDIIFGWGKLLIDWLVGIA